MAEAYYEPTPATDGATMNPVPGAVFQVFEIADQGTWATPLSLRVGSGNPTTTVAASDTLATLPGVYVTSPNFEHIWKSGTFEWRRDSIDGAKKAIEDAKIAVSNSASDAALSKQAAEDAASLVGAPADTVMRDVAANPGSAFATELSATIASETAPIKASALLAGARPNTWASIGDSISAAGKPVLNGTGGHNINRRSWQVHANIYLGQRLEPVNTLAVSGKTAAQVLTEQVPELLALNPRPGYCAVMAGTNDINGGSTDTQVITALQGILNELLAANIRPIIGTIPPRTGFTGAQITYHHRVNAWIRANAPRLGAILVDWFPVLSNTDGTPKTNVHQDGLHPTPYGAALMGKAFFDVVKNIIPEATKLPASNAESPNPILTSNPLMTGTGGTASTGGTGSVATSYLIAGSGGAAYTAALSKVARTDGVPGDWQQAVISGASSVQLYQKIATSTGRFAGGDTVYALIEFEADGDLATPTEFLAQTLSFPTSKSAGALTKEAGDTYTGPVVVPNKGVIRTPDVTLPADITELWALIKVVGSNGTFRVGRVSVLKV